MSAAQPAVIAQALAVGLNYEGGKVIDHVRRFSGCVAYANCQIAMDAPYHGRVADEAVRSASRAELAFHGYDESRLVASLTEVFRYAATHWPDVGIVVQIARGRSAASMQRDVLEPLLRSLGLAVTFAHGYRSHDYYTPVRPEERFVFVNIGMFAVLSDDVAAVRVGDVCRPAVAFDVLAYCRGKRPLMRSGSGGIDVDEYGQAHAHIVHAPAGAAQLHSHPTASGGAAAHASDGGFPTRAPRAFTDTASASDGAHHSDSHVSRRHPACRSSSGPSAAAGADASLSSAAGAAASATVVAAAERTAGACHTAHGYPWATTPHFVVAPESRRGCTGAIDILEHVLLPMGLPRHAPCAECGNQAAIDGTASVAAAAPSPLVSFGSCYCSSAVKSAASTSVASTADTSPGAGAAGGWSLPRPIALYGMADDMLFLTPAVYSIDAVRLLLRDHASKHAFLHPLGCSSAVAGPGSA